MTWPEAPMELLQPANDLTPLLEDKKTITDLIENANENYASYYTRKLKYNSWIEWYNSQKQIFESVK